MVKRPTRILEERLGPARDARPTFGIGKEAVMNMASRFLKAVPIVCVIAALAASAASAVTLTVATDPSYPPMESRDSKGDLIGFDMDLIKEVARLGGFTVKLASNGWDYLFPGLSSGKFDAVISSISVLPERRKTMDFSEPYLTSGLCLVARASDRIRTPNQLAGKVVGTQSGFPPFESGLNHVRDAYGAKVKLLYGIPQAALLTNGSIDCLLYDEVYVKCVLLPENPGAFTVVGRSFDPGLSAIAVRKGNAKTLALINTGLRKALETGVVASLRKKWLWRAME
jgi:ABC-type amino acid transport substrate-binding protein